MERTRIRRLKEIRDWFTGEDARKQCECMSERNGVHVNSLVRFRELLEMEISEQIAVAESLEKDGFTEIAERRRERVAGISFARDYFCDEIPEANDQTDAST